MARPRTKKLPPATDAERSVVVSDPDFEGKHPRGPGGQFIRKGASGGHVRTIQRQVGADPDGEFGAKTAAAVRRFQRRHGLQVDGVVGHQTLAAMRGHRNAAKVKVGAMTAADRRWLARRRR